MEQPPPASFPVAACVEAARGATRRYLLHQISVTIGWMPHLHARLRGGALTRFFLAASACGEEGFYFAAVPVYMWLFDSGNALALVLLFACNLYVGNWLKNYLQLPRPPLQMRWDWPQPAGAPAPAAEAAPGGARGGEEPVGVISKCAPPAAEPPSSSAAGADGPAAAHAPAQPPPPPPPPPQPSLPAELTEMGYGWPSTHAMNAVALPFYLLRCAFTVALWELPEPTQLVVCGGAAVCWALAICASRVYLGVHSPADVQGGMLLGALSLRLWTGSLHRALSGAIVAGTLRGCAPAGGAPADGAPAHACRAVADAGATCDLLLCAGTVALLLLLCHPVVAPIGTATFAESVSVVGFGFGFVVGAHAAGGNRAAPVGARHAGVGNALGCLLVGGAIVVATRVVTRALAQRLVRCAGALRVTHAVIVVTPLLALARAVGHVHGPLLPLPTHAVTQPALVVALLALAAHLDVLGAAATPPTHEGARETAAGKKAGAVAAAPGARLFGAEGSEAVIARFLNYACCGFALTAAVPLAFERLGLR